MGNGAAIKRGARAARGDILVFMDADGQHDPADIARLLRSTRAKATTWWSAPATGAGQAGVGRGLANTFYNWLASSR